MSVTLGDIRIMDAAVRPYAAMVEIPDDEARVELERILLQAKRREMTERYDGLEQWRYRGRPEPDSQRVEVTVGVTRKDGCASVVSLSCRWHTSGRSRGRDRPKRERPRD